MKKEKKRPQLLSRAERSDHYNKPHILADDYPLFFSLNDKEYQAMKKFGQLKTQIFFILQLGYFRAKQQFYNFDLKEVEADVAYILNSYFDVPQRTKLSGTLGADNKREQKQLILDLCEYELWSSKKHKINTAYSCPS